MKPVAKRGRGRPRKDGTVKEETKAALKRVPVPTSRPIAVTRSLPSFPFLSLSVDNLFDDLDPYISTEHAGSFDVFRDCHTTVARELADFLDTVDSNSLFSTDPSSCSSSPPPFPSRVTPPLPQAITTCAGRDFLLADEELSDGDVENELKPASPAPPTPLVPIPVPIPAPVPHTSRLLVPDSLDAGGDIYLQSVLVLEEMCRKVLEVSLVMSPSASTFLSTVYSVLIARGLADKDPRDMDRLTLMVIAMDLTVICTDRMQGFDVISYSYLFPKAASMACVITSEMVKASMAFYALAPPPWLPHKTSLPALIRDFVRHHRGLGVHSLERVPVSHSLRDFFESRLV